MKRMKIVYINWALIYVRNSVCLNRPLLTTYTCLNHSTSAYSPTSFHKARNPQYQNFCWLTHVHINVDAYIKAEKCPYINIECSACKFEGCARFVARSSTKCTVTIIIANINILKNFMNGFHRDCKDCMDLQGQRVARVYFGKHLHIHLLILVTFGVESVVLCVVALQVPSQSINWPVMWPLIHLLSHSAIHSFVG